MTDLPKSQRAEEAMIAAILRDPAVAPEVFNVLPDASAVYFAPYRMIYDRLIESHYADEPMDALWITEALGQRLAKAWRLPEKEIADRLAEMAGTSGASPAQASDYARIVKRHSDYRALTLLADRAKAAVLSEDEDPETIAGLLSAEATLIATDQARLNETLSYRDLGRRWVIRMKEQVLLRRAGVELGAYFDLEFIDDFVKGLRATELWMLGGEPGVGKSAVIQIAAENFARRQMKKTDKRVATLMLSMEMGEEPNSTRLAQRVGKIDGDRLREARISDQELYATARSWANDQDMPLHINHASLLRESQMRALVAEEVRRNNVGLLIIDHFRMIEPDNPNLSRNDADDQIVKFLKMGLAKDMNLAVICLAHTIKGIERMDKRPRLSDLRGSGAIAAFADFVSFVFRPWPYATDAEREQDLVKKTEAEMIWAKSRHSSEGTGEFFMNLAQMHVR